MGKLTAALSVAKEGRGGGNLSIHTLNQQIKKAKNVFLTYKKSSFFFFLICLILDLGIL